MNKIPFSPVIDRDKLKKQELFHEIKRLDETADNLNQYNIFELKQIKRLLSAGVRFKEIN